MTGRSLAVCLVLVALCIAVYAPVRDHAFVDYDDVPVIVDNPIVREGFGIDGVRMAFTRPHHLNWVPLSTISHQIDRALWGTAPAGTLLVNVALHALSAVLLFLALSQMTGSVAPAAFVAAVFAVHPLHVESVAWASERKDVLSGLFWMAGLLAWAGYVRRPSSAPRYALVLGALVCSLLSKATAVTFPFALLLLDFWPLRRLGRRAVVEKVPMFAAVAAVSIVTLVVQRQGGAMDYAERIPWPDRLANALVSWVAYLGDAFWPKGLAAFYPFPSEISWVAAAGAALLLAALTTGACLSARTRPWLAVGWLWYGVTLTPMIGIVQVGMHARADRYAYVSLIGISIALAWEVADRVRGSRSLQRAAAVAGVLAIGALAVVAHAQVGVWKDTLTLFRHAVAVTEDNSLAWNGIGDGLRAEGDLAGAADAYREALAIRPGWRKPANNLAWILATAPDPALRDPETAVTLARNALRASVRPDPQVLDTLAAAQAAAGRFDEAVQTSLDAAAEAERIGRPDWARAFRRRADAYRDGRITVDAGGG